MSRNNMEMSSGKESLGEGPKIELPKGNPELIEKLRRKLEDYKTRLKVQMIEMVNGEKSIQLQQEITADTRYKIAILQEVIDNGFVYTNELSKRIELQEEEEYGQLYSDYFKDACDVIDSYCKGETEKVIDGTGLK